MSTTLRIVSTDLAHNTSAQGVMDSGRERTVLEQTAKHAKVTNNRPFALNLIVSWHEIRIAQRELRHLLERAPDHILNDVGLTAEKVEDEIKRLRWNPFKQR